MRKPHSWLLPLAIPYQAVVQLRNRLYNLQMLPIHNAPAPVISVGNISVGGTGKSPFVIYLAQRLQEMSGNRLKTAVVTRGYLGQASGTLLVSNGQKVIATPEYAGDEPVMIAEAALGLVVIVDKDRVRGATVAVKEQRARVVILDDGFQHRRLNRDLDIVLLDAGNPLGNRFMLPAGYLREPLKSLARADLIVLSKAVGDVGELEERRRRLEALLHKPVIVTRLVPRYWRRVGGSELFAADQVGGKRVVAFAGIARPGSFFETVRCLGVIIADRIPLPDHCRYSKSQLDSIARRFVKAKAEWLVTTAKDAIKLPAILRFLPVYQLETSLEVASGGEHLEQAIARVIKLADETRDFPKSITR
jgi:tetraacyldisaccharide 4'-kinase